jgi:o-succinylbenzoate---CoA ligase
MDPLRASAGRPETIALVDGGQAWTFAELDERVQARVESMERTVSGAVAPVFIEPDAAGIVELLALWRAGSVPVPLNARLSDPELDRARASLAAATLPRETQVVLWTSGTSGRPRGVALSWNNLTHLTRAAAERLGLDANDVWLATLSPAHVGGLALVLRALLLGGTLVCAGRFEAAHLSDLLDGRGLPDGIRAPTRCSLVPTQLLRVLEYRAGRGAPDSLRSVLVGGAHAPASLVERALADAWPVALTYGATEASSQVATAPPELVRRKPGSVGPPLSGIELRIAANGEILVRGPTRALAYVGEGTLSDNGGGIVVEGPAARDDVVRGAFLPDEDGWYHTGDLGRLDEDGDLWITGRRIDRIVSGGVTVDAVEVEEALRAHATVVDACVVGIPDEEWGERIAAWVEPVVGEFDVEAVSEDLRAVLSAAKLPRAWHVAEGLPRNANGKVDRAAVRARLERLRES